MASFLKSFLEAPSYKKADSPYPKVEFFRALAIQVFEEMHAGDDSPFILRFKHKDFPSIESKDDIKTTLRNITLKTKALSFYSSGSDLIVSINNKWTALQHFIWDGGAYLLTSSESYRKEVEAVSQQLQYNAGFL